MYSGNALVRIRAMRKRRRLFTGNTNTLLLILGFGMFLFWAATLFLLGEEGGRLMSQVE